MARTNLRNRKGLDDLLARGARVRYFHHHYAGAVPTHRNLVAVIDESDVACTSGLVDRHLCGRHRIWAIVGAFGDGFEEAGMALARALDDPHRTPAVITPRVAGG